MLARGMVSVERNVDLLKSQFDIDREPFSDIGITGLFYPGAGRQKTLEQLLHLARYGPPLLFLNGAQGAGKTLLAHHLYRQLDNSIFLSVSIDATVLMDDQALMQNIAEGFNLQIELTKDSFVSAMVRFAKESESYSQTALVLIDEVQNLSESAVDVLAATASAVKENGLRFLLLVDVDSAKSGSVLAPLLALMESLGQSLTLPALNADEVSDYLAYRMRTAGLDGVRFSPQQVRQIAADSEGIIARINQLARETLVRQVPVSATEERRQLFSLWHLAAVAVISVGIVLLIYGERDATGLVAVDNLNQENEGVLGENNAPLLVKGVLKNSVDTEPSATPYVEPEEIVPAAGEIDFNYTEYPEYTKDQDKAVTTSVKAEALPKMEFEAAAPEVDEVATVLSAVSSTVSSDKSETKPKPVEQKSSKPESVVVKAEQSIHKKERKKPRKKPRLNQYTLRETWLLSLDPKQYTLQMIGARDEDAVQAFISQYPSLTKVAYYKTLHKGKDWYVVIYGQFTTRSEAKRAVERLPKNLVSSKPWTRRLAEVQKDIRMARL